MHLITQKNYRMLPSAGLYVFCLIAPATAAAQDGPSLGGIPVDFILFGLTLLGVALFHRHTLSIALGGLGVIVLYQLNVTGFNEGPGTTGLGLHLQHEWVVLTNLLCLLLGFALLARHFENSGLPALLPRCLPDDWKGAFSLLLIVFVLSSFLDNIAATLIGGTMLRALFARVHIGYLAAIVAAANAGGAGSVMGDTTTTMIWIAGVDPREVLNAYVGAGVAMIVFGIPAAIQQQNYSPILKQGNKRVAPDWIRVIIVALILLLAIGTNIIMNVKYGEWAHRFPFIGVAIWVAIALSLPWRRPDWEVLPEAFKGSVFLLALVTCASLMPVEALPPASWPTALGLGFVSAIFDNIPLTALALKQGGYDWGFLAYAVGFGGSMLWFGSSAGVTLANMYGEAKSVGAWLRHAWYIPLAYVAGFFAMWLVLGWHAATT